MERMNLDYPIAFRGYETSFIDDVICEKDRIIGVQEKDLVSLKREIVDLKKKINCSKNKKKWYLISLLFLLCSFSYLLTEQVKNYTLLTRWTMFFKKFVVSYDHRVDEKYVSKIKDFLKEKNIDCLEIKCENDANNDYPILASKAYGLYLSEKCDGMILLCGTGVGMNVVANKFAGIRSVLAQTEADAYFSRNDENANCIVFPAGKANETYSVKICKRKMIRALDVFINTPFEGGRHQRRLDEITEIERGKRF